MDHQTLEVDLDLIAKLDRNGPRYTSYPTADRFADTFDSRTYAAWAARRNRTGPAAAVAVRSEERSCIDRDGIARQFKSSAST